MDLTHKKTWRETLPESFYWIYLSGIGAAARILYDRIPAGADPLGPENILSFTPGFLAGTGSLFMGRWTVSAKSPLTGGWGDANCGGSLAPALKRCGYDGVFIQGISPNPVYLRLMHREFEFIDADHIWGKDAFEAEAQVLHETGDPKARAAVIGTSGENLSLISGIVSDSGRIAARSGLGAVMGSKNLKAVVFSGRNPIRVRYPSKVKQSSQQLLQYLNRSRKFQPAFTGSLLTLMGRILRRSPVSIGMTGDMANVVLGKFGSIAINVLSSENGDSPVKNWKGVGFKDFPIATHAGRLDPQKIIQYEFSKYHCYSCPLGCGGQLKIQAPGFPGGKTKKPEYETCCAFGPLVLNRDLKAIFQINEMLNRAGMDSISAGATVAFAIELKENGILSQNDLDGIDLDWGRPQEIIAFLDKMISRKGCGDMFADGTRKAAQIIGNKAETFAMHAGGQELAMHDCRYDPGFAVSYSLEPAPGKHTSHGYQWLELFELHRIFKGLPKPEPFSTVRRKYDPEGKWRLQVEASKYMQLANAAGACLYGVQMGGRLAIPDLINHVTGWKFSPAEYLKIGERIQNLRQAFNFKHGLVPVRDFALPPRVLGCPPMEKGPLKGVTIPFDTLSRDFLNGMGWTIDEARPTKKKLIELDLVDLIPDLYSK